MNPTWTFPGSRLVYRQVEESDAETVTRWRNSATSRAGFFSDTVVTPDTHRAFVRDREPHDLVWITAIAATGQPIGMKALTVDIVTRTAESGRTWIDEVVQGRGFSLEQEFGLLWYAFEVLRLEWIWGEVLVINPSINAMTDRMGWRRAGVDVVGHTYHIGPVQLIEYTAAEWAAKKLGLWEMLSEKIAAAGQIQSEIVW